MVVQARAATYDASSEMITDSRHSTALTVRARPAKRRERARALLAPRVRGALEVGMLVPQPARSARANDGEEVGSKGLSEDGLTTDSLEIWRHFSKLLLLVSNHLAGIRLRGRRRGVDFKIKWRIPRGFRFRAARRRTVGATAMLE